MYCTAITCMDGRFIQPLHQFIWENFSFTKIDTITDTAPVKKLLSPPHDNYLSDIIHNVEHSLQAHNSTHIFVCSHEDCSKDPAPKEAQMENLKKLREILKEDFPEVSVSAIYISAQKECSLVTE